MSGGCLKIYWSLNGFSFKAALDFVFQVSISTQISLGVLSLVLYVVSGLVSLFRGKPSGVGTKVKLLGQFRTFQVIAICI